MRIVKSTRAAAATAVVTMAIAPVALAAGNVHSGVVLHRDGSKAVSFVRVSDGAPAKDGFDWEHAGIGAAFVAALVAAAGTYRLRVTRREPLAPTRPPHSV